MERGGEERRGDTEEAGGSRVGGFLTEPKRRIMDTPEEGPVLSSPHSDHRLRGHF